MYVLSSLQYEDEALGELDEEEEAAKARNNADISDFSAMLDDFLLEQAEMEAQQDDLLQRHQAAAGGRGGKAAASKREEMRVLAELGGDDAIGDYVGGDEYDDVHGLGGSDDDEKAGSSPGCQPRERVRAHGLSEAPTQTYRKVQALDDIDPEVITKTRERIAAAEAEALKRMEKLEADGKASTPRGEDDVDGRAETGLLGEAGDLFNEVLVKRVVEQDDRWDCESVLSLRSNLENHPARIAEPQRRAGCRSGDAIRLSSKTGMPAGYGGSSAAAIKVGAAASLGLRKLEEGDNEGLSDGGSSDSDQSDGGHLEAEGGLCLERRKDETPEEKRARKAAVKEAKREARASKKALKTMFREEGAKQRRQAAGSRAAGAPSGGSTFVIA
jgi:protein LTV1